MSGVTMWTVPKWNSAGTVQVPREWIHLALFTSHAKLIHRHKNREKILEKNAGWKNREKKKKNRERGNKKKEVEQDRREN